MKRKLIAGFSSRSKADPEEKSEEEKPDYGTTILSDFIKQTYSPIGSTDRKLFKTSAELAYELREIVELQPNQIAKALSDAGFRLEFIHNKPYWVMYEK